MFIKPSEGRITSPFGMRIHPITKVPTPHRGLDYGKDGGTRIVSSANGTVSYAKSTTGYGNTVMIVHSIGGKVYETIYAHLATIGVKVGQIVKQGEFIGVMGTTGASTGVHLHFELHVGRWNNKFTNAVNPLQYIVDAELKAVQGFLVKAGYELRVDGIAGAVTTTAIKAFQTKHKLTADGVVGKSTLAKLKEVTILPNTRFKDVTKKHSAYESLERLSIAGIVNGYEDGTFRPNEPVTRAHMAVMLDRAIKSLKE